MGFPTMSWKGKSFLKIDLKPTLTSSNYLDGFFHFRSIVAVVVIEVDVNVVFKRHVDGNGDGDNVDVYDVE